jgi:hypothetical protein
VNSKIQKKMEKVQSNTKMVEVMREIGKKIKEKVLESTSHQIIKFTKETGLMMPSTVLEN